MAILANLFSGSKGNSTYIGSESSGVLIDAGLNTKNMLSALSALSIPIKNIHAIFITHEHIDHINALKVFTKKYDIKIYAPPCVCQFMLQNNFIHNHNSLEPISNNTISVADMQVKAFKTSHDSLESVGYIVSTNDQRKIAVATDLGFVSDTVLQNLLGCDAVLIESNYDNRLLELSSYPYNVKQRIKSKIGHLSNDDCAKLLPKLVKNGTTRIMLAHLSLENNLEDIAYQNALATLSQMKMKQDTDFLLKVAKQKSPVLLNC